MAEDRPHIGLLESSLELTAFTDEFHEGIRFNGLVVEREQRDDPLVYAAIEPHDLPTIIVIWLASTYFTEFVKKISGSHFSILERELTRLAKKLFHREKDTAIVRSGEILFDPARYRGQASIRYSFLSGLRREIAE